MNASSANTRHSSNRRAYALLMVLMFNVLFLMLLGVTWRQMSSALRIAKVREEQAQRDEGVVCAMARAMNMLETGQPPNRPVYNCYTTITTSSGTRFFPTTFTLTPGPDPTIETWTVSVTEQSTQPGTPFKLDTF